ncbi:MAG TPA: hypothetical protein VJJ21_03225 [Candidatus Nanoarchaeia archaeon]|nr:hypothetical protein [Candidatus Nanoarchaeia archaeon]
MPIKEDFIEMMHKLTEITSYSHAALKFLNPQHSLLKRVIIYYSEELGRVEFIPLLSYHLNYMNWHEERVSDISSLLESNEDLLGVIKTIKTKEREDFYTMYPEFYCQN